MLAGLKQFVPSDYCFKCKSCCVFESSITPWRPLIAQEEKLRSCVINPAYCFDGQRVDPDGYVKTMIDKDQGRCDVLTEDYLCRCYESRPFECRLYPFVVIEKDNQSYLAAHLSCPYVLDHLHDQTYHEYIDDLIKHFQSSDQRLFLNRNKGIARTYGDSIDEFDIVYELGDLSNITISDHLKSYDDLMRLNFKKLGARLSAYAFPGVAVWEVFFGIDIKEIDGVPCVFASNQTGTFLYTAPLSNALESELIDSVFELMEKINVSPGISRIENVPEAVISFFNKEKYRVTYKSHEFIYRREDIVALRGNAYKSKRSDYNYFRNHHDAQFVAYETSMGEECAKLFEKWVRQKGDGLGVEARQMIDDARQAHQIILNDHRALGMIGRAVKVNGRIVAYTFGYPITDADFCIFAEVADRDFKGLPSFIFREFCRDDALCQFDRINVMDAFGLPNLETTKHSFRPAEKLAVYTVYKNP